MQRAAVVSITENGIVTLGRDGGGSAEQKGRLIVRPGGMVCWEPLAPGQVSAELPPAAQGLAPGELPQQPPPAIGHALGVASESQSPPDSEAPSPPAAETKASQETDSDAGPPAPGVTAPGPDAQRAEEKVS